MVTDRLTERMGSVPNLSIKRSVSIGTMINFDRDGDGTCKQTFQIQTYSLHLHFRHHKHRVKVDVDANVTCEQDFKVKQYNIFQLN